MADPKITRVLVGQDGDNLDFSSENDIAAIGGLKADVKTGTQGIAYAGAGGQAVSVRYGIAIVGSNGTAIGGAGAVAFAYDGGSASGGDGAVAIARRDGPANVAAHGVAVALDSSADAGRASIATTLRQNALDATAHAASEGIAVVRSHPSLNPASRPAIASAENGGIAIAFDDNWVKGAQGSLLIAAYVKNGQLRYAVGVVDGALLKADQAYRSDSDGAFVAV